MPITPISAISSSLSGIQSATKRLEDSAERVARLSVRSSDSAATSVDSADYANEFTEQTVAKVSAQANARVLQAAQEMMDAVSEAMENPKDHS